MESWESAESWESYYELSASPGAQGAAGGPDDGLGNPGGGVRVVAAPVVASVGQQSLSSLSLCAAYLNQPRKSLKLVAKTEEAERHTGLWT